MKKLLILTIALGTLAFLVSLPNRNTVVDTQITDNASDLQTKNLTEEEFKIDVKYIYPDIDDSNYDYTIARFGNLTYIINKKTSTIDYVLNIKEEHERVVEIAKNSAKSITFKIYKGEFMDTASNITELTFDKGYKTNSKSDITFEENTIYNNNLKYNFYYEENSFKIKSIMLTDIKHSFDKEMYFNVEDTLYSEEISYSIDDNKLIDMETTRIRNNSYEIRKTIKLSEDLYIIEAFSTLYESYDEILLEFDPNKNEINPVLNMSEATYKPLSRKHTYLYVPGDTFEPMDDFIISVDGTMKVYNGVPLTLVSDNKSSLILENDNDELYKYTIETNELYKLENDTEIKLQIEKSSKISFQLDVPNKVEYYTFN